MTRKERLQWEGRRSKRRTWCHGAFCLCSSRKNAHVRAHFVRRQIPPILVFLDGKNISSCSILLPHFCVFQQNVPRKAFPRYPSVKKLGGLVCQLVPLFVFYLVVALANIVAWPVLLGAFSPVQWEAYKEKHRRSHKTYGRAWMEHKVSHRCHRGVNRTVRGFGKARWTRSPGSEDIMTYTTHQTSMLLFSSVVAVRFGFSRVFFWSQILQILQILENFRAKQLATWGHGGVDGARLDVSAAGIQQSFVALDLQQLRNRKLDARQIGKQEDIRSTFGFLAFCQMSHLFNRLAVLYLQTDFPLCFSYLELRSFVWENMGSLGRISVGCNGGEVWELWGVRVCQVKIFRAFF